MTAGPIPTIATLTVMRGEHDQLVRLLESLAWADERHVVETGPEVDGTAAVVADQGASAVVHHDPRPLGVGFDDARAVALGAIRSTWTLVVDTDERIPPDLVALLRREAAGWEAAGVSGVWLPRLNVVLETPLGFSSSWPDYQLRFLRTTAANFTPSLHVGSLVDGPTLRLPADVDRAIRHDNFRSTEQFLSKLNLYSTIEASQEGHDRPPTLRHAVIAGGREFLARYVKMRGYKDGGVGFHYASMYGMYRYLIGAKRWEAERRRRGGRP